MYTEWFHSDCLADYYHVDVFSEEYWRIVENFLRKAKERGVNMILTPILTLPLETFFDYTKFHRRMDLLLCGSRI